MLAKAEAEVALNTVIATKALVKDWSFTNAFVAFGDSESGGR